MNVGDKVNYIPGEAHAMDVLSDGSFVYQFGRMENGKIIPLSNQEAKQAASMVARGLGYGSPNSFIKIGPRPEVLWKAIILALNDDGTALLEIESHLAGITLEYNNVPEGHGPHNWYA